MIWVKFAIGRMWVLTHLPGFCVVRVEGVVGLEGSPDDPLTAVLVAAVATVRLVAGTIDSVQAKIDAVDRDVSALVTRASPALISRFVEVCRRRRRCCGDSRSCVQRKGTTGGDGLLLFRGARASWRLGMQGLVSASDGGMMGRVKKVKVVMFVSPVLALRYTELAEKYGISRSELYRMTLDRGYRSTLEWCSRQHQALSALDVDEGSPEFFRRRRVCIAVAVGAGGLGWV